MGMTMTQKILAAHSGNETVVSGQLIMVNLDRVLGNDITSPVAIKEFNRLGADQVFDKEKVKVVGQKDSPFHKSLSFYFKPQTVQNQLDSGEAVDIYGYLKEEN